jgi:hypothetical protein
MIRKLSLLAMCPALWIGFMAFAPVSLAAGPYSPGSEFEPYGPVHFKSTELIGWASGWENYDVGSHLDSDEDGRAFDTPEKAIGKKDEANVYDIVSLGRGGSITMTFSDLVRNGPGWDFAVFENSAIFDWATGLGFLELAFVEVSSNGVDFVRFDAVSLTRQPVTNYVDYSQIHNVAGKYPLGYGTPFDLSDLEHKAQVASGVVDLDRIGYVRVVDIIGDGREMDIYENKIYDPYPTINSAGFDLWGIGIRYVNTDPAGPASPIESEKGDISGDGFLTLQDVMTTLGVLAGKELPVRDDFQSSEADVDVDGCVGMEETLWLLRELAR